MSEVPPILKTKKGWCAILFGAWVLAGLIVSVSEPTTPPVEPIQDENTATTDPVPVVEEPVQFISTEAQVEKALEDLLGATTIDDMDRFISLTFEESYGEKMVTIDYNGDSSLTTNLTRVGLLDDAKRFFEEVAPKFDPEIKGITLAPYLELVDAYGNTSNQYVMLIDLHRDTWEKIQWDNFTINNFPTVADIFWESPIFAE